MRNVMKIVIAALLTMTISFANSQTLKFGHINLSGLVQLMPEKAAAAEAFEKEQAEVKSAYDVMQKELQDKFAEYEELGEDASEIVRNAKAAEIQEIQQRVQTFSSSVQNQLAKKQTDLMAPIIEKAKNAINEVAKEKGLIYVFDVNEMGVVLYHSNQSIDLLPLVKAKLGIQ
ncbi:Outer membrane protein H precursor [hydrothermal vent metagenome]|uniref:Outer membrane protein H n=1 Tax=hydrothermal vent metagenome TaxID=652676 RepID=A0A3B0UF63_9ZZZZ